MREVKRELLYKVPLETHDRGGGSRPVSQRAYFTPL